jgi:hypothetical protein
VRDADDLVVEESVGDGEAGDFAAVHEHETAAAGGQPDLTFGADLDRADVAQPGLVAGHRRGLSLADQKDSARG